MSVLTRLGGEPMREFGVPRPSMSRCTAVSTSGPHCRTWRTRPVNRPSSPVNSTPSLRVRATGSSAQSLIAAAADRWFQGAARQRCRVHFIRNLLAVVPKSHQHMAAALFRTIFAQPGVGAVADAWDQVSDQLAARFPKTGPLMETAKTKVLAFATFPRAHWQKIWSTNPLERINKEIWRRSRVVGIFPNEASAIRLVGAILADLHDEWQATDRRYLSEDSMSLLYPERDTIATAELTAGNHHRGSTQNPTT